ncbi:hypothetical protein ACLBX9_16750 [Methylobacterium sp. A49B]
MPASNDNGGGPAGSYSRAYGPTEVVIVEAQKHERSPYWRMVRLPGATVQYGYRTVRDAVIGEAARTLPVSGAAAL